MTGSDQLQHRQLHIRARLIDVFKGRLDVGKSQEFSFEAPQTRESEFIESDYHGLWSHTELKVQTEYLTLSRGVTRSISVLLNEESCLAVLDNSNINNVDAALEGELTYQSALKRGSAALDAAQALLAVARERRVDLHGLFEQYLWARISPIFAHSENVLLSQLLTLISAQDAAVVFRSPLISDVCQSVVELDPNSDNAVTLVRQVFALLHHERAETFAPHLVEVELYNLTVRGGNAQLAASRVFPNSKDRAAERATIARFHSERAQQIEKWLGN